MSPWWTVVALVLAGGTIVTLRHLGRVLNEAATVLDGDRGVVETTADLSVMREEARIGRARLGEVGRVAARPHQMLRAAHPLRPWNRLIRRWRSRTRPAEGP